ncbi:MAG: hypothetical protein AB7W59_18800 [Acidimicrobiia bacterium]
MEQKESLVTRLLSMLGGALARGPRDDAAEPFMQDVKVVHVDDLRQWAALPRYDEHESMRLADYEAGARRIAALRRDLRAMTELRDRLDALDSPNDEEYDRIEVTVPRSLLPRAIDVPLPEPPHEPTTMVCREGPIDGCTLRVRATWRPRTVSVSRSSPSRIVHRAEIETIRQQLAAISAEQQAQLDELATSRFAHPVLFVSHRWEGDEHPDPRGEQYRKLVELRDCFLVYDFCSFPQKITSETVKDSLQGILRNMNRLIRNVIILDAPNYLERGWCLYEYVLASLASTTVCDEVQDPDFVALRNFRATRPTSAGTLRGHSIDSDIQNGIAAGVLDAVNHILPKYARSSFSVEADRELVTSLLVDRLLEELPSKKEYPSPYLGEWIDVPWTREDLRDAFQRELPLPGHSAIERRRIRPYVLKVPATLDEAVANRYALDDPPRNTSWTWLERIDTDDIFRELSVGCGAILLTAGAGLAAVTIAVDVCVLVALLRWHRPAVLSNPLVLVPLAALLVAASDAALVLLAVWLVRHWPDGSRRRIAWPPWSEKTAPR